MDIPFLGEVVREMKNRPYTMLVIIGTATAIVWLWSDAARAADVQQQFQQTNAHLHNIDITLLENNLRSNQRSLFDVQARMTELRSSHKPVDGIYTTEEQRLQNVIGDIQKQLEVLYRQ